MTLVLDKIQLALDDSDLHTENVILERNPIYGPKRRFLPGKAKEVIREVLQEKLSGAAYDAEIAATMVREIADDIRIRLKDLEFKRYKIVVQAVVGELRNQAFQMTSRCFWDPETDDCAKDYFMTQNMFALATVFGIYLY